MAGVDTLLPTGGAFAAVAAIIIALIRFLGHDRKQISEADRRYDEEVAAHRVTQQELDAERTARRRLEDTLAVTNRKLEDLTAHVERLEKQLAQLTGGVS